jgi:hypothetical protein
MEKGSGGNIPAGSFVGLSRGRGRRQRGTGYGTGRGYNAAEYVGIEYSAEYSGTAAGSSAFFSA